MYLGREEQGVEEAILFRTSWCLPEPVAEIQHEQQCCESQWQKMFPASGQGMPSVVDRGGFLGLR